MRPEHWIYTLPLRLRSLFRRPQVDQDLDEEIRDHLERRTEEYVAQGMSLEAARYAAQREFGGVEQAKEKCRDTRKLNWIYDLAQDVGYTLRQLRKNPGFAALAIVTLALGIGANTAMFTVMDSVLIRPLPFRGADRMVAVEARYGSGFDRVGWRDYPIIRDQCRLLEDVAAYDKGSVVMQANGGAQTVATVTVTANLFDLLDVRPAMGRPFLDSDSQPGARPVAILSDQLWREYFAADTHIIGRQIRITDLPYTVVGVMPDSLRFPFGEADGALTIWMPFQPVPEMQTNRSISALLTAGKLRPGVRLRAAQAELAVVSKRIAAEGAGDLRFILRPLRDVITEAARLALLALAGALILVLLIACVNVANLQLARHLARRQELAVRAALGAGRSRLLRQLIAEGAVLAIAGALAGLGFASILLLAVHRLPANFIPRADEIKLRVPVFAILALFAAVTTIVSSLAPALLAVRTPPEEVLREGSGGSTAGRKRSRLSEAMVVGEVALSAILLVSAGLMFYTLYNLEHIHFGFDLDRVTTFTATPANALGPRILAAETSRPIAPKESIVTRVYQPIRDRLRELPGVVEVGFSAWAPFDHNTMWVNYRVPKHPEIGPRGVVSQICLVSSGYAGAIGTPVVEGRIIADSDTAGSTPVAVVNETFARRAFPGENPVGEPIVDPLNKPYTIVGVLGDARQHDLIHTPDPEVLLAYQQFPTTGFLYYAIVASGTNYIVRTRGNINVTSSIRQIFRQCAPDFALDHFRTLRVALDEATFNQRLGLYLTGSFAGVAILMVLTGLYGVLSQLVGQRRREIGIRMALGASRGSIQAMILRRALLLSTVGLAIGLSASLAVGRLLRAFLFGVKPIDGLTYFTVAIVLLAVSIAAALIPARKAAKTNFRAALQ
jgi:predicted permease